MLGARRHLLLAPEEVEEPLPIKKEMRRMERNLLSPRMNQW
jgi:hypothetical protein